MKILSKYNILIFILLTSFVNLYAQKKVENIGSEVVNVIKPYVPVLSDVSKIKEIPKLDDAENSKKIIVKYNIFSFPVASIFIPSKGIAATIEPTKKAVFFDNYLSIGFGIYNAANIDFFVNHKLAENQFLGAMLQHESSQGGIKNVDLNNKFYDTNLDLGYQNNQELYSIKTNIEFENKVYNWYGLPKDFGLNLLPSDKEILLKSINSTHIFNGIGVGGSIVFKENIFKNIDLNFNRFWDSYGSNENRFILKPSFEISINDKIIKTNINVDYLAGSFKNLIFNSEYSFVNFGICPNYIFAKDDLTINFGVNLVLGADNINTKNKLFLYPKITASYKIVGDYMIAFAGLSGNLNQNSYRDLVNQNPFVAPSLTIVPTDSQYNLSFGLKGKLSNLISYSVNAAILDEKNKVLFKSNDYTETLGNENFGFGNSFRVVYDNVKTFSFNGELKARFSKNIDFSVGGTLNSFNTNFELEAWNLPQIEINATSNIVLSDKWSAGFNLFFVGQRKDSQANLLSSNNNIVKNLDAFIDLNFNVGYNYSKRLSAFLKANNIANQGYQKWLNFPVQQFQLVLGAAYKFDFL